VSAASHWEEHAHRWAEWARTPGHDAYWDYRDAFFELVPPPGRATLEVGCGEGRVSRDLAARGHVVTGVDLSGTLVDLATEADPGSTYLVGDASALPFPDGSFDLAVAYNSLMDADDMPGAVAEIGRVLEPAGSLCICVTHPTRDACERVGARWVVEHHYLERRPFHGTYSKDGLTMTFSGWCHPLEAYSKALEAGGFAIEAIREPPEPAVYADRGDPYEADSRCPNFMFLRAKRG
jgi:ubiquinone/menaquinone biosynthesis C-methylase UbiE